MALFHTTLGYGILDQGYQSLNTRKDDYIDLCTINSADDVIYYTQEDDKLNQQMKID